MATTRRLKNWRDRLPAEIRQTIEEVRYAWQQDEFRSSALALARSIRDKLASEGHDTVSVGEIRKWLSET